MKFSVVVVPALAATVSATARNTPPNGAITVCPSGCKFNTIQKAVNSITGATGTSSIFIYKGVYNEQVTIPQLKGKLNIYGQTANTLDYTGNTVTLQHRASLATGAADDEHTAALINTSKNVNVYNINIKNTYGKGSQAIALSAYNTQQGYYGVGLYGYQDTLLAQIGNQIYANCYIEGAVDFIFGQHARAWITGSRIAVIGTGSITASGRPSSTDPSYYVITDSTVEVKPRAQVAAGTVYLGRPWSNWARVAFQRTSLPSVLNGAGWDRWSAGSPNTDHVTFQEYGNSGAGARGTRARFSSKLGAPISIGTVLGGDYANWVDRAYL